jgi:hypothetical protein
MERPLRPGMQLPRTLLRSRSDADDGSLQTIGGFTLNRLSHTLSGCTAQAAAALQFLETWVIEIAHASFVLCKNPPSYGGLLPMTKLLDHAVEAARALPPAAQDDIARLVLRLTALDETSPVTLSDDERTAIAVSKAAALRGEFATEDQVRAVWAKHATRFRHLPIFPQFLTTLPSMLRKAPNACRRGYK